MHGHGLRDAGQQRGHAALDGALRAVAQHTPDDYVADVLLGKRGTGSRPRTPRARPASPTSHNHPAQLHRSRKPALQRLKSGTHSPELGLPSSPPLQSKLRTSAAGCTQRNRLRRQLRHSQQGAGALEQLLDAGTHRWVDACALQRSLEHGDQQVVWQRILQAAALCLRSQVRPNEVCRLEWQARSGNQRVGPLQRITLVIGVRSALTITTSSMPDERRSYADESPAEHARDCAPT